MNDKEINKLAKWPESLPPPTEVKLLPPEHVFYREDLISIEGINDVIHDLYYFPEDKYFLYFEYENKVIPDGFSTEHLENMGLILRSYENYYYRRPWSEEDPSKYSYIRLKPGEDKYPWQKEIIKKGPMFSRVEINLMEWKRKIINIENIKHTQNKENINPIILQPNFMGMGLDLKSLYSWLKNKWSKKA